MKVTQVELATHGRASVEQIVGPVDTVQAEWYAYVRCMKAALAGSDLEFFKPRKRSAPSTRLPKPNEAQPQAMIQNGREAHAKDAKLLSFFASFVSFA